MNVLTTASDDAWSPVWVTQAVKQRAEAFANQQPTPQKAHQVYRNALAVGVVNDYLQLLGIQTDLNASDSWQLALRFANDVADVCVVGRGRLECRSVPPEASTCYIPLEAQCDRIGYIIVRFDTDQDATLLGFVDHVDSEYLPIEHLRPMAELPQYLAEQETIVDLRQWLEGLYQIDWHPPEHLLQPKQLALGHQLARVQRAKLIRLNLQAEHSNVVLLISVTPQGESLSVRVQLHPAIMVKDHTAGARLIHAPLDCLMPTIKLSLQTDDRTLSKDVIARAYPRDNCIQIPPFQGLCGERFSIQIAVDGYHVKEYFQL